MIDAAMMVAVLGTTALALAVDVAVLVGWLRRAPSREPRGARPQA
jgi:hypothetical protein